MTDINQMLENADVFLSLKDYGKALKKYTEIIEASPTNWRGWWGAVETSLKELTSLSFEEHLDSYYGLHIQGRYINIEDYYIRAITVGNDREKHIIKERLNKIFKEDYYPKWDKVCRAIINGDKDYIKKISSVLVFRATYNNNDGKVNFLLDGTQFHQILKKGLDNAKKISGRMDMRLKRDSYYEVMGCCKSGDITFAEGKTIIRSDGEYGYDVYSLPIQADKIIEEGDKVYQNRIKNRLCLYCGNKISIFGKCKKCKEKFEF